MLRKLLTGYIPALLAGIFLVFAAQTVVAQDASEEGSQEETRPPRPNPASTRPIDIERMLQMMEDRMELTDAQWDDIDAIVQEHEHKMEEARNEAKASIEDQKEQMRQLMQERAEARQSGDEEKEREIREKLQNLRPTDFRVELEEELVKNINEVLEEEQQKEFHAIVQAVRNPAMDPERVKKNPSLLRRAVMQLELDQEQREKLDELFQNYWQDRREVSPSDKEAMDNLALDFYDAVLEILDDEQRQQLDSKMTGVGADAGAPTQRPDRGQDEDRPDPHEND